MLQITVDMCNKAVLYMKWQLPFYMMDGLPYF